MSVRNLLKLSLVSSVLLSSSVLFAQDQMQKRTPEERAKRQTEWMEKNLSLTQDQDSKVYNIVLKYAQMMQNTSSSPNVPETQRQGIMTARDNELKGVLTGDQFQKFQAHETEMREKMRSRQQGNN